MIYLKDNIHRYAASLIVSGFHGNVYSAIEEAERWEDNKEKSLTSDWNNYYLVNYEEGSYQYRVYYQEGFEPDVNYDRSLGHYRW